MLRVVCSFWRFLSFYARTSDLGKKTERNRSTKPVKEVRMNQLIRSAFFLSTFFGAQLLLFQAGLDAWEPSKPIAFVIPAGTGGGADQMARLTARLAGKTKWSPRPLIAVNKSGGAGAEGFLYVKEKKGDPHVIVITLSNLFTTPLHTGVPFNWKDLTPLARMALDEFI